MKSQESLYDLYKLQDQLRELNYKQLEKRVADIETNLGHIDELFGLIQKTMGHDNKDGIIPVLKNIKITLDVFEERIQALEKNQKKH